MREKSHTLIGLARYPFEILFWLSILLLSVLMASGAIITLLAVIALFLTVAAVLGLVVWVIWSQQQFDEGSYAKNLASFASTCGLPNLLLVHGNDGRSLGSLSGENWRLFAGANTSYNRWTFFRYKELHTYNTVMEFYLPEPLPRVSFMSVALHGKRRSEINLEGDFNEYFSVEAADFYKSDVLSFITPQVMQVLKTIKNLDITVSGQHLVLNAPYAIPVNSLGALIASGDALQDIISNKANTYRDRVLKYEDGLSAVSIHAVKPDVHDSRLEGAGFIVAALLIGFLSSAKLFTNNLLPVSEKIIPIVWILLSLLLLVAGVSNVLGFYKDKKAAADEYWRDATTKDGKEHDPNNPYNLY